MFPLHPQHLVLYHSFICNILIHLNSIVYNPCGSTLTSPHLYNSTQFYEHAAVNDRLTHFCFVLIVCFTTVIPYISPCVFVCILYLSY